MVRAEGVAQRPLPPIAWPARPTSVDKVGAVRQGEAHRGGGGRAVCHDSRRGPSDTGGGREW
jgi:hypothetical protein